jgi:hypothetical protein
LKTRKAKLRHQAKIDRLITVLMLQQSKKLVPIFNRQYTKVANSIERGSTGINPMINAESTNLKKIFKKHYLLVGSIFSTQVFALFEKNTIEQIEQKQLSDLFIVAMNKWIKTNVASQVKEIQKTTKKKIQRIINKGLAEGLSSLEIARKIRDKTKFNLARARLIARTETHTASVFSVDASMKVVAKENKLTFESEWVTAGDLRVRGGKGDKFNHKAANGQRVQQGKPFIVSGEKLFRPGDTSLGASVGNIVRCRCVLVYHAIRKRKKKFIQSINNFNQKMNKTIENCSLVEGAEI